MFIRLLPLIVGGILKYLAASMLINHLEKMFDEAALKRDQNIDNTETPQSET